MGQCIFLPIQVLPTTQPTIHPSLTSIKALYLRPFRIPHMHHSSYIVNTLYFSSIPPSCYSYSLLVRDFPVYFIQPVAVHQTLPAIAAFLNSNSLLGALGAIIIGFNCSIDAIPVLQAQVQHSGHIMTR